MSMKFLYAAYACEKSSDRKTNLLLPGFPVKANEDPPPPRTKIQIELPDGTILPTTLVGVEIRSYMERASEQLRVRPGFFYAVRVPGSCLPPGIELGVKVFADDNKPEKTR